MNAMQAILSRKSTRSYQDTPLSEETLSTILEAGMAAPVGSSAYDSLHLTVVQNEELFSEINAAVNAMVFKMLGKHLDKSFGAPAMIFISSKPAMLPGLEYANAACVLENMAIAATSLGIDSVIWGGAAVAAQDEALSEKLGIPKDFKPLLCVSLGYGKEQQLPKKHKISTNWVTKHEYTNGRNIV